MTSFGLSMGVSARETTRRVAELGRRAEDLGVDALWVLDSQLVMQDVYVSLAVAAWETNKIQLGTGVTNPFTRHTTVTANAISTIDKLSNGRALLGVGNGDSSLFPLGLQPARVEEMHTWVGELRTLLRGESVQIADREVSLRGARSSIPIFVAASQPRMLRLAGALADGVIMMGFAAPELVTYQLSLLTEGLQEAGRKREDVFVDYWATVSIQEDQEQALYDVKSWAAGQARWLSRWREVPPGLEPYQEEALRAAHDYDFGEHLSVRAHHAETVSDEFARMAAIAGDTLTCRDRIEQLAGQGLERITMTLLSGGREDRLEQIGELIGDVRQRLPSG